LFTFLDESVPKGWEKTGQLERLFRYISSDRIALLELSLSNAELRSTYVLEGDFANKVERFDREIRRGELRSDIYVFIRNYFDSRIKLEDYDNNYKLPEVIIPRNVQAKRISLVDVIERF
jgi:hypothetical protein